MSKKVTNASKHPVAIRLVKRAGASVGFSDGIKPAGAVDDSIELSFNLGGYTPDDGRFVIGTSATPNIKNPQTYVNNGEQFKIINESNRLLVEADITTHDADPNYSSLTFGIFFRLKNTDGDYVMASPRATQAVVDYKNVKTQVEKTVIKQSVGQWFNDSNYYVPLYLGTLKELLTHWATTTGIGMPELKTLGSKAIYNKMDLTVDLPLTSVSITTVGDFEIGTTVTIEHTYTPAIAKITNVAYSVSDPTIAEFVGATNQLQIKSMGSVDVTVTLTDNIGNEISTTKTFKTVLDFAPMVASYAVNNSLVSLSVAGYVSPKGYVDWGDGTLEPLTENTFSHQYVGAGQRDVTLWVETPTLGLQFVPGNALTEVKQWGDVAFPTVALAGNTELIKVPNQIPLGLQRTTSMFEGCVKFNQSLNGWNVSGIVDMSNMFNGAVAFNGLLDAWDVSKVVAFERMFEGAVSFNRNINTWVMSAARNLTFMFKDAAQYNQPIAAWRLPLTGGAVNVSGMFEGAISFNQPIVGFINTNVNYLGGMFKGCTNFNQPISGVAFGPDIQIQGMFENCISFNGSVGNLNGAKPTNLRDVFKGCSNFNQTLVGLDMSECTVAESFLEGCTRFNQALNDMDVSNLNNATNMFKGCTNFTSDLSDWDVSNLHQANGMFSGTTNFDSDLGWWCVSNLQSEPVDFATGSFLARSNYPKWGTCPVRDVTLTIDKDTPFLIVGSTGTMTYTANKTITEESVVWGSSNPDAVTINAATGEFAVISVGGATITVVVNGIYSTERTYESVQEITPAVLVVSQHADPLTIRLDSDTSRNGEAYVDWGDGTFDRLTAINSLSKTYTSAGPFNVSIIPSSTVGSGLVINGDGVTALTAFGECDISITSSNLESVPASLPSTVTSFGFQDCVKLNDPNISNWNVNNIKDFSGMFAGAIAFNQPLDNWVMTQATDLSWMFGSEDGVSAFNQNIAGWDVSNVTNLNGMFYNAAAFNQDIGTWSVSKVTKMGDMFHGAVAMAADLSWWCVSAFTEAPTDFATGSGLTDGNFPYWGTCPIRTAVATIDSPPVVTVGDTFAFSYTLTPAFTPGKVEWTTTTPSLITLDVASGIATVIGDGQANLTVTVNDKIVGTKQFTAMPLFTPFTAVITGESFDLRTMEGATIVRLDGVELAPDESEDTVYDWYTIKTSVPGSVLTVSPKDSVSPLESLKLGSGIGEVTEWCSLGHIASPEDTKAPVLFGRDIVSVPDYLPVGITNLTEMFYGATLFNQPIGNWDVSNVTDMSGMFASTVAFNQNLSTWNTSNVTTMAGMFRNANSFNGDISGWDVRNVTNMQLMFEGAVAFNQPLNGWNLVSATNLHGMFRDAAVFNQPLNLWNVSNVTDMANMFRNAGMFNQDLTGWCVTNITSKPENFNSEGAALQSVNQPFWGTCPIAGAVVTINLASAVDQNSTAQATYELDPAFTPGKVEWSTTTPEILSVDANGLVTGLAGGVGKVKVTINQKYVAENDITVNVVVVPELIGTTGGTKLQMFAASPMIVAVDGVVIPAVESEQGPYGATYIQYQYNLTYTDGTPKPFSIKPADGGDTLRGVFIDRGVGVVTTWDGIVFEKDPNNLDSNGAIRFGADITSVPATLNPSITTTRFMFGGSKLFNQDISGWNTVNVVDMAYMFSGAEIFNHSLDTWNVSNVTNMSGMFGAAYAFDGVIGAWDTSKVTNMAFMFDNAIAFNQDISGWDVSKVTNFNSAFNHAVLFNQPINSWNPESAVDMSYMFAYADALNQPLNDWNVGKVEYMDGMFRNTTVFNGAIGNWNTGSVKSMTYMFTETPAFNQPLAGWDVSKVTNFNGMFANSPNFNQPIGNWNVRSATDMYSIFSGATLFNQDLSWWCVTNITSEPPLFALGSSLATENYPVWGTCPVPAPSRIMGFKI